LIGVQTPLQSSWSAAHIGPAPPLAPEPLPALPPEEFVPPWLVPPELLSSSSATGFGPQPQLRARAVTPPT